MLMDTSLSITKSQRSQIKAKMNVEVRRLNIASLRSTDAVLASLKCAVQPVFHVAVLMNILIEGNVKIQYRLSGKTCRIRVAHVELQ